MSSFTVENAKSGRSKCKVCKGNIDMAALRIGTISQGPGDYDMLAWRHLECQKRPKAMDSLDALAGLTGLSEDDQAKVKQWFEAASAPKAGGGAAAKKRKADEAEGALPELTGATIKKMKAGELKAALEAHGLSTAGKKAEHVARLQEVADRRAAEAKFSAMKTDELKDALRENGQLVSGAKQELVERCVDGFLFGALPRCPECGGAVLRIKYPTNGEGIAPMLFGHGGKGSFFCPGYFDDDHWHRCKFVSTEIERTPWKDVAGTTATSNAPPAKAKKDSAKVNMPAVAMPDDDD